MPIKKIRTKFEKINKLKDCFENLKDQCKIWEGERKKQIPISNQRWLSHMSFRDERVVEMIRKLPWKLLFGHQTPPHALLEDRGIFSHASPLFLKK
jgi:hypothetical protein